MAGQIEGIGQEFDKKHIGFTGTDVTSVNPIIAFVAEIFGFTFRYGSVTLLLDAKTRANAQAFLENNYDRAGSGQWVGTMLKSYLSQQLEKQLLAATLELPTALFEQALGKLGISKKGEMEFVESRLGGAQNGKIVATHKELIMALKPYERRMQSTEFAKGLQAEVINAAVEAVKRPPKRVPKVSIAQMIPESERAERVREAHGQMVAAFRQLGTQLRLDKTIEESLSASSGRIGRWLGVAEYKTFTNILDKDISQLGVNDLLHVNHELERLVHKAYRQTKYRPPSDVKKALIDYTQAYTRWWYANAGKEAPKEPDKIVSNKEALQAALNPQAILSKEQAGQLGEGGTRQAIKARFASLMQGLNNDPEFQNALRQKVPDRFETARDILREIQSEVGQIEEQHYSANYIKYLFSGEREGGYYLGMPGDVVAIIKTAYPDKLPDSLKWQLKALSLLIKRHLLQNTRA